MKKSDYFGYYILVNENDVKTIKKVYGEKVEYCGIVCGIDHREPGNGFINHKGDKWYLTDVSSGLSVVSAATKLQLLKKMTDTSLMNFTKMQINGVICMELKEIFKKLLFAKKSGFTFDIETLQKAIDKYGCENQKVMLFEEMAELQKEVCKEMRGRRNRNEIIDETVDVLIMIEQLKLMYQISTHELESHIDYKIKRLKERLGK